MNEAMHKLTFALSAEAQLQELSLVFSKGKLNAELGSHVKHLMLKDSYKPLLGMPR